MIKGKNWFPKVEFESTLMRDKLKWVTLWKKKSPRIGYPKEGFAVEVNIQGSFFTLTNSQLSPYMFPK